MLPASSMVSPSWAAETVKVCGTSQLEAVNTALPGRTRKPLSAVIGMTHTSASGSASSTTV